MKWTEFLKRKISFCTVYAHVNSYTQIVPNIIGCQLSRVAYHFDGKLTHIAHEQSEIEKFGDSVRKKIIKDSEIINLWVENAIIYNKKAEEFLSSQPDNFSILALRDTFDFFSNYLANAVHIPHRLSWVFDNMEDISPAVIKRLIEVRTKSYFLDIDRVCLKMMEKLVEIDPNFIKLINPEEVFNEQPWPSEKEILHRAQGWLLRLCDGNCQFISGHNTLLEYSNLLEIDNNANFAKGNIAYPGKVKGQVVLIKDLVELKSITEGSVLVTNMTTPAYIPYLKKVKAIVTDEGGITCHAAIISREMKIPCVIGTKVATQVFKDGDLVEVDANKGIVKKL
ncbi:MAG: PEP-utilizing enzyme [Candidatus Buchananbacteria bacterium]